MMEKNPMTRSHGAKRILTESSRGEPRSQSPFQSGTRWCRPSARCCSACQPTSTLPRGNLLEHTLDCDTHLFQSVQQLISLLLPSLIQPHELQALEHVQHHQDSSLLSILLSQPGPSPPLHTVP
ncbi:ETS domain-containing protein Elk-4 isoform X1 [Prionailurus iriomotensis]